MSRILLATLGSLGDLHPYIAVARALLARGHEAIIATTEEYRAHVEGAGVAFAPVRPNFSEVGDYRTLIEQLFHPRRGPEYLIRHVVMPRVRHAYDDLMVASEGADLLVSHALTFTLPLVAERRNIPWVATVLTPLNLMSSCDPPLFPAAPWLRKLRAFGPGVYGLAFGLIKSTTRQWEAPLRELRRELGFAPSDRMAMFEGQFSPLLNLALFDPLLAAPQPDWPPHLRVCGAPLYDGPAPDERALDALEEFLAAGGPPIVFALGSSVVWIAGDFWEKAAAAARQLGRRAILLTGPTTPQNLPEGVRAFPYLPYSRVFPRGAAVVHQAGIGTLSQALRAGRPQLVVPVSFDQPDNARRAAQLGLARVVPFRKASTRLIATELDALLCGSEYVLKARAIAQELAAVDGAARAANELIGMASSAIRA